MKNNTKTTIHTIFDGFIEHTQNINKRWQQGENNIYNNMCKMIENYNGEYNLRRLLYWTLCGQVDTAIRPVMYSMIDFLAVANGYCNEWVSPNMADFMRIFMTGIKKTQIKNACKVFAQGCAIDNDSADFERILTKFYCDMTIKERIDALYEQIKNYTNLVK